MTVLVDRQSLVRLLSFPAIELEKDLGNAFSEVRGSFVGWVKWHMLRYGKSCP